MKTDESRHDAKGRLRNGPYEERFKNGSLSCAGRCTDGEKDGEWKSYDANGTLTMTKVHKPR